MDSRTDLFLSPYYHDDKRSYLHCSNCCLVFVPEQYHLSAMDEKAQYDLHQNDPEDPGYQNFLMRTVKPLFVKLAKGSIGLDFGCGPGPAISLMGKESGFKIVNYDLYYFHQPELLDQQYDFVTMTEVIEHIADPIAVLTLLNSLLTPGAILAIMSKRVIDQQQFKNWHYKNDPTHICFYAVETFHWIADKFNWRLEIIDKDVVFFYKGG